MENKRKNIKFKTLVKGMAIASLFVFGLSCSEEEDLISEDFLAAKSEKSVELTYESLTASGQQDANPIENIDDEGDDYLETRWSAEGMSYVYIDFGAEVLVDYVNIAFFKGDERKTSFKYYSSEDGEYRVYEGGKTSSGKTEGHELFDLKNMTTRYLKFEFNGSVYDDGDRTEWNSVLDLEVYGTPAKTDDDDDSYTSILNRIEAETYDTQYGIRTEETADIGGGLNVGWIATGDFMQYNVNVPESGDYKVDFRVASSSNRISFDIYSGDDKVGNIVSPTTGGWQVWKTVSTTVNLDSGDQTIKILSTGPGWNINWFEFKEKNDDDQDEDEDEDEDDDPIIDTGDTAEDILGDFWKITLPVDTSGNGSDFDVTTYDDRNNDAGESYDLNAVTTNSSNEFDSGVDTNDYFYIENGWAIFKAFCGGATTTNSQYPRTELRGLDASGDDSYFEMSKHQELEVVVKVLEVPVQRPEVNMVQIHGPNDEPLRVEFNDGSTGSDQGLHLTVNESDDSYNDVIDYEIGQELKVWVKVVNGHLWIELDNLSTGSHYETDYDVEDETGYWKVGCYLQGSITYCDVKSGTSFCKNGGESDEYYTTGAVAAKDLKLIRDGKVFK